MQKVRRLDRIPGIILAGGRATRMGSGDKAMLPLGGQTLLAHVLARLGPQCGGLAISANGDAARLSNFGLPVLADTMADFPGPLAGILAGLDWAADNGADAIVTAATDTPFLPLNLVERLGEALAQADVPIALAASTDETGATRRHPTFGLWPVSLREDLRAQLSGGLRKLALWADRHGATTALFAASPFDPFFNVNTPQDMVRAEAILRAPQN